MERTVDIKDTPIIFPKYTAMLMERGVKVDIVGQRETDSKLASMLYSAVLHNSTSELPDIMKYNIKTKTWESIYVCENERVVLQNQSNFIVEYTNAIKEWTEIVLNAVKNFVSQFSAASIKY